MWPGFIRWSKTCFTVGAHAEKRDWRHGMPRTGGPHLGIRIRVASARHGLHNTAVLRSHPIHPRIHFSDTVALVSPQHHSGTRPSITLGNGAIVAMPKWAGNPIVVSIICGIVLFTASTVQQYGILYSGSAGRSGFITALYIVMTPLLAFVILRRRVHLSVIISVAISVIGFYLLCVTDGFGSITLADMVLLFTAVLFAGHILVIDTFGRDMDPILLSFGQITTTAIISWIGSIIEGSIDWAGAAQSWIAIVYAGVCSAGVAYTLQVIGQQLVPPTRASVIMSLESFFSAVGGALLLGEIMTTRAYLGWALIFAGTILAQLPIDQLLHAAKRKPADVSRP